MLNKEKELLQELLQRVLHDVLLVGLSFCNEQDLPFYVRSHLQQVVTINKLLLQQHKPVPFEQVDDI
jgi:hypothetical protein